MKRYVLEIFLSFLLTGCNTATFDGVPASKKAAAKAGKDAGADAGEGGPGGGSADSPDAGSQGKDDQEDSGNHGARDLEDSSGAGGSDEHDDEAGGSGNGGIDGDGDSTEGDDLVTEDGMISDRCDRPEGTESSQTTLRGEDVPGNGFLGGPDKGKPFGGDFDDFALTLSGPMIVEKDSNGAQGRIGSRSKGKISVSYSRGTTDCSHLFRFKWRKCPNKDSTVVKSAELDVGRGESGQLELDVPASKLFLDIELATTASSTKKFGGCPLPTTVTTALYGGGPVLVLIP